MALKAIVFKVVPSLASSIDLICLSPTILELICLTSCIENLGSELPDPNGAKLFTLLKKSKLIFRSLGSGNF